MRRDRRIRKKRSGTAEVRGTRPARRTARATHKKVVVACGPDGDRATISTPFRGWHERPSTPAARLRALRPAFIPIVGPVGQRKGPKIIAVPRVEAKPPAIPEQRPAVATASDAAPAQGGAAVTAAASRPAVRLGRLPPRAATAQIARPACSRTAGLEAIAVTATLPRRPLPTERRANIEARAARFGVHFDADAQAVARAVAGGAPAISIAPRGLGHELAALAASVELPQLTLVIGPDARTLADIRERLERASVRSTLLNDAKGSAADAAVLDGIAAGAAKVVLTTPRWLARDRVLRAIGRVGVAVAIVLEAQTVSPLGAGFSPAHARLSIQLERLGRPPAFALAPGAGPEVRHDIAEALLKGAPLVIGGQGLAANVSLSELRCPREMRRRALSDAVGRLPKPMLVLCATPQEVDAAYDTLRALGIAVHRYHEEMGAGFRAAEQLEFSMPGEASVLVATSAFAPVATAHEEDPENVPARYGRRTAKADIRSLLRVSPPASLEQLTDELSLVARDGKPGQALILHDLADRHALEAQTDATRPSGEQIMLMARALESMPSGGAMTTEALALAARSSRRAVEGLAALLDAMGLVTYRDGWLTRLAPESVLLKELRGLAERYATVRVLDTRRLGAVLEMLSRPGCKTATLGRALGNPDAKDCGACASCRGETAAALAPPSRHAPVRRFSVQTAGSDEAGTFHADSRVASRSRLTAKLADFR